MKYPGKFAPRILIAAGPTREKIDPVRFISNYSTGSFGYELAAEALRRGAKVTLVSGPTHLTPPRGVRLIRIESAIDLRRAVLRELSGAQYVIMSAAVSDWRVKKEASHKIKRSTGRLALELVENPDILKEVGSVKDGRVVVGFALETEDLEKNALKKLFDKNADIIVANALKKSSSVFGDNCIDIIIIDKYGNKVRAGRKSKKELSKIILDKVLNFNI